MVVLARIGPKSRPGVLRLLYREMKITHILNVIGKWRKKRHSMGSAGLPAQYWREISSVILSI